MRLLILGGTRFLGRHLVEAALARAHDVTLFHRGTHPVAPRSSVETIYGDRHSDLAKLHGRRWDAVIDTSGYHPQTVRASAIALADAVQHYTPRVVARLQRDTSLICLHGPIVGCRFCSRSPSRHSRMLNSPRPLREPIAQHIPDFETRKALWYELVDSEILDVLADGDEARAREIISRVVGFEFESVSPR